MGVMATALFALSITALIAYPIIRRFHSNGFVIVALVPAGLFLAFISQAGDVLAGDVLVESVSWIPQLSLNLVFRLDALSFMFALLVTGAGALILVYCRNYFEDSEDGLARFGAVFVGFTVSMLGLVLSDNVYLLFIFWEATTVFSFLLIGHSQRQRTARSAALQALIVTTLGGLAMLVGLVILSVGAGTANLSEIVASPPKGVAATVAVFLLLVGALSKSAIFPFHFWLPGAMAAPTPVSAYLHAAAMVKAGVYLIARIGPGFGEVPGYRETLVILGAITMLNGGIRALRQFDIKLIVAHGTVSQLGFLVMIFGLASPLSDFAGLALLFAHAVAKAPLFLAVGIIDHGAGTRDLRKLSGLGRQVPALTAITVVSAASMVGLPPFIGFVAKEAVFTELIVLTQTAPIAWLALIVSVVGSILTVAYMGRFLWGAFATKRAVDACTLVHRESPSILFAPMVFAVIALGSGVAAPLLDPWLQLAIQPSSVVPEHLALWHGFTPALGVSTLVIALGVGLTFMVTRLALRFTGVPERFSGSHIYWLFTHWIDVFAIRLTSLTQRGSLPFYLSVILIVLVGALAVPLIVTAPWPGNLDWATSPAQISIAMVMILATLFAVRARTRFQAVVLVGVTGYGMASIFMLHGAPDLALTQALVETVTLIAFVLVIRRLPQHIGVRASRAKHWVRAVIGVAVGLTLGAVALVAMGARIAEPISLQFPELAYAGGHGSNVVNVTLVDIRGWDTLGELSVVLAAATGVASLVFVKTRIDILPKLSRRAARIRVRDYLKRVDDPHDSAQRSTWLLAGKDLDPSRRSIILEVVVRVIFHALILLSFYLLLTGHNTPGGGFAGGLVAGLALVARYLTGGRAELGATVPVDAGRILGAGLALATTMAILPIFFGQAALASSWIDLDLGPLGILPLVTSTLFDVGVYLVVFGLILDVLRSLGAEVDRQEESESEPAQAGRGDQR
ncbi:Na+/H+ antiporter subunit A [Leucobacter sp. W1153]|uniref:Na+/H+ antiporter subunit A n=1 Tax=Leucobacter sp. W1153 TaxID=3439064 RepID=UPI003F394447